MTQKQAVPPSNIPETLQPSTLHPSTPGQSGSRRLKTRGRPISKLFVAIGLILTLFAPLATAQVCAVPGADGVGVLSGVVNTYYAGNGSWASGSSGPWTLGTQRTGGGPSVAAGDLLLIIQMQDGKTTDFTASAASYGSGVGGAGLYEYARVAAISGTSVTLAANLINTYTQDSANRQRFQVVRVPQYSSATISGTVTSSPWTVDTSNGEGSGGIVAMDVAGSLNLEASASINVSGQGFRGGAARNSTGNRSGGLFGDMRYDSSGNGASKGEGTAGTPRYVFAGSTTLADLGVEGYTNGSYGAGAPGNAGGGANDGEPIAGGNQYNAGGGGGANAGAGGVGGKSWNKNNAAGGRGGKAASNSVNRVVMGGGGGAGGTNSNSNTNAVSAAGIPTDGPITSSGSSGGGIVLIRAGTTNVTAGASINVNGSDAFVVSGGSDSSGGGGAGGSVVISTNATAVGSASLTISAIGGKGGSPNYFNHGAGGGGAGGYVASSSNLTLSSTLTGGLYGPESPLPTTTPPRSTGNYGASSGDAGTAQIPGSGASGTGAGADCLPALSVGKTTSSATVVRLPGAKASYTVTVSNAAGKSEATNVEVVDLLPVSGVNQFTLASSPAPSATLTGTATGPSAPINTGSNSNNLKFGQYTIPGGSSVTLSFTVDIPLGFPTGTINNSADAVYTDPTRTTTAGTTSATYAGGSSTAEDVTLLPAATISGTVWDDRNADTILDSPAETGTNAGGLTVYAISGGQVVGKSTVSSLGVYSIVNLPPNTAYTLRLSTDASKNPGDTAPLTPSLPSGWFNTGENANGTPDFAIPTLGEIALTTTSASVSAQNFGVRQSYTLTPPPAPNSCQFDFSSYLNTGISATGGQLATGSNDLRWTAEWITGPPSGNATPYATPRPVGVMPAVVSGNAALGQWINEPANARWISYPFRGPSNADGIHADADLDGTINEGNAAFVGSSDAVRLKFTTYLTLPASANFASINVPLRVAVDNEFVSATVNNVANINNPTPNPYAADFGAYATIPLSNGWQAGVNTIEVIIDSGPNAVGFLIALDGTATQLCAALSGTVWDDRNGDIIINGAPVETGTNAGGLHVYAVNAGGIVSKSVVAANGSYTLNGLSAGPYTLRLSTVATALVGDAAPPASSLPTGWVNTGERNTTGTETSTPGDIAVTVASSDLGNLNFGIEQPPTANAVNATSQANPGGATQVTVPTLGGTDPEDVTLGAGSTIVISSLATDGTLYYNGNLVTLGQVIIGYDPSLLKLDPDDGAVTVSFGYKVRDAALKDSPAATVSMPFSSTPPVADPITTSSIPSSAGDTSILKLTGSDPDGTVVSFQVTTLPLSTQGVLRWDDDNNAGTPAVAVTTSTVIPFASADKLFFDPAATFTGDATFAYTATDNSGLTSSPATYKIPVGNNPPTATNSSNAPIPNSAGPTTIAGLQASDTDGTIASFKITSLPPATQGALTKADGTPVSVEDDLTPDEAANLKFVPNGGFVGDYLIGFTATDNLNAVSKTATATILVTAAATVSGTVWDDKNGDAIRAATGEAGTNANGLNAVLTDPSGNVLQVVPVASNGTYSFTGITPNTALKVLISTTTPAINSNLTSSSVPSNWTTTSPTVLSFDSGSGSVSGKDFGIEQLPTTDDKTLAAQINPPGATRFTVPTLTGNDPEDLALSTGNAFQITQLPSNAQLYYDGTLVLLNQVISGYDPSKLTVDPDDDATSVTFKVAAVDAASKADPSPATVTMNFTPGVAPVAKDDSTTTTFNTAVNLDPKSNDTSSVGTTLDSSTIDLNPSTPAQDSSITTTQGTFALIASGPDAGKVTFTPNPGFVGTATTPYTIQDNLGQTSNAAQLKVDVLYPPAPVAADDSTGTPFNTAVILDLKLNDDASVGTSLDPLKIDLDPSTPGPDSSISTAQGTFELITTGIDAGKVRFTPTTGFTGAASTPYTIKDSLGQTSNSATITVTVTAPGAPVAKDDNASTAFNTSVNLDPKLNDTSSGGTTLDASKIDLNPATAGQDSSFSTPDGTFTLITSGPDAGKVTFAPNPGFVGTATTPYTIKDSLNQTSNAAILKVVVANPPAPTATNDDTTTTFNTPVNLDPKTNDTASAGTTLNPLKIDLDPSTPAPDSSISTANGTFTLITTGVDAGKVTFAPNPGFTGTASIPYTIQDSLGQTSNNAILSVAVGNPPAPIAKDDVAGTPFNTPVTVDAKTNDTSSPGTTLDPAKIDLNPATPGQDLTVTTAQGTFDLITTGPDAGKVKFTPVPGFTGTASIPYTIKDNLGQTSNPATITVTVANPGAPVANDDGTTTTFNTAVNLDPKTNDTSSGGTTLDASTIDLDPSTPVQDPSVTTTQGTFALITSGPDAGKVKFTPVAGFVGTATAPYTIKDSLGQISNQATLSVIVNNPPAPVAKDDSSTTAFNTPVNLDAPANDTSSTGTTLDASKLDLNPATAAQDSSISTVNGTFTLITSGPDAGKVTFAPVPGFVGTATTPYTIKDSLGQTSNAAILSVVVGNPAAPAATNDTIGTPFNTAVTIDAKSNDTSSVGTSLNPAKIDLKPATPGQDSSVTTTEGTFVLITTGPDSGKVKFTPVPGFTGTASVPYTIQDNLGQTSNMATITVTVAAPDAPTAQADTANTALNTPVTIDPKANDSAVGGATLDPLKIDLNPSTPGQDPTVTTAQGTFTLITTGPDAGKVTFTPATGFVGTASVPYTIKDNAGTTSNTSSITVTVAAPNAPVATNDTISTAFNTPVNVPVTLNDTAAPGATLDPSTIDLNPATPGPDSSVTTPEGTFTVITSGPDAGKVTFAPVTGFTGTATVPYTIKDNFAAPSNQATIKVTVNPPAVPIANDDAISTALNTAVNLDPKTNDTPSSGTNLNPLKIDLNPATPGQDSSIITADGTFTLIASGIDAGKVKFTPNPGFTGTASTPYTIQDNLGQTSNQANLRVTVIGTPTVVKSFASSTVAADGTVAMSITISNPNGTAMNGVAFTDSFPAGLEIAVAPTVTQCGGTVSSTATSLSLSAGTIPANSSCTISATVKATKIGAITNVLPAGAVTTSNAGSSPAPASATLETASVGAAKSASVINNGDGTYNITYLISLENLGSVPLTNVQAIENLENTFTGTATWSLVGSPSISGGTGLTLNPSFTGRVAGSTNLLNAASSGLAIGATSSVSVTVRVNPNGNPTSTVYNNQVKATATGNGPGGATIPVTDQSSNSGTNPDPNGNGNPNEPGENDPTGVSFNENPSIGVAKSAGALTSNGNGTYTQAFSVIVRNYGDVPLTNLSVTENLSSVFGTALVSTGNLNVTGAAGVTANAGFNGNAQTNLAATGSALAVGATATFNFEVVIRPSATAFSFTNSVTARGSSPSGSIIADDSVNGLDPNPTPGSPNNDTSGTPIVFAAISGHVFSDINGDGTQQALEPNLNANTVTVTPATGPAFTVLTDANGDYTAIVPAGSTSVSATAPAGNLVTTANNPQTITAVAGSSTASTPVGFQPKGTIKGHVWTDRDFSGVQEPGEPNLANTSVTILDSSGTTQTVQTDANGDYTANVPFGPVTVTVSKPAGSRLSTNNNPQTITVTDSSVRTLPPVGFHPDGLVSGVIFEDTNGNGLQDPGENGLLGIPVKITDVQGTVTTVLTDSNGAYSLNVPAGATTIAVTTPGGTILTTANATQTITAIGKTNTPAAKIGFQPQNKVVGHVFNDPNGNGIQDAGETNIANQDVIVTDSSGAVQTVKTNANGDYVAFVIPGKTGVNVVDPSGSSLTTANDPQDVTVLAGQTGTATPVGFQARGTISGHLFNDIDGNGLQDPGEPNLPGLTVTVTDANGKVITLTSDANGDYTTSVPVGPTNISVTAPNGSSVTTGNNPQTVTVPVAGNVSATPIGVNTPVAPTGSLTGRVFTDTNGNGVLDNGEQGIAGAKVTVLDSSGQSFSTTTDTNGNYSVPNLAIGTAKITISDPSGLALTTNNNPQDVTIASGSSTSAANVGYVKPSLQLSKKALSPTVAIGEILEYELTVTNSSPIDVRDVVIIDELPLGLAYKAGSSTVANLKLEPKLGSKNGRQILTWTVPGVLTPNASSTIKFATIVTPSATQKLENVATASVRYGPNSTSEVVAQSEVATTKIVQAVFNNKSVFVGRVYFDRDRDANFTSGIDVPLAGARVYLSDGRYAITDAQGRYSVPDITPGVYVVRLDRLTAPYTPVRVPTDVGLPGTRRVDAQGGLYEANFPLLEPDASVAKERETMVERGSVKLEKILERIPSDQSSTEKPGYVIRETITVSKTIANLTITDPLPQSGTNQSSPGASRGPILLVGSDGKEIIVKLLEDGRIQIPGRLEAGTYTLVYAIYTTLTPDQVVTDPSINYDEVIR